MHEVSSALVGALNSAKGISVSAAMPKRGLGGPTRSFPVMEDDLATWMSVNGSEIKAFLDENPVTPKIRLQPAFLTMCRKLDNSSAELKHKVDQADVEANLKFPSYEELFMIIGKCLPFALEWTDFAAEVVEFTTQQGGYPTDVVGALWKDGDAASHFGSIRSLYVLAALGELFGEDGIFAGFPVIGARMTKFLALLKPATSDNAVQLFKLFGEWDMKSKAQGLASWASGWASRFDDILPLRSQSELSYVEIVTKMQSVSAGFKGKVVVEEKSEADALDAGPPVLEQTPPQLRSRTPAGPV